MTTFKILNRLTSAVQFETELPAEWDASSEKVRLGVAVKAAVKIGAYLRGADLGGAYLGGADLRGAYLGGADLRGAFLDEAKTIELVNNGVFQAGPVGSRKDYILFFRASRGIYVRTGCFGADEPRALTEFEAAVQATHGDSEHGKTYRALIACVKTMWEV